MNESPLIANERTRKIEKARGYEDFVMDMLDLVTQENINNTIIHYFATQAKQEEFITDEIIVGEDNFTIKFSSLTVDGDSLPSVFQTGVKVAIWSINNNSDVFIHSGSITGRQFTVSRKTGRVKDQAKVQFIIKGKEE